MGKSDDSQWLDIGEFTIGEEVCFTTDAGKVVDGIVKGRSIGNSASVEIETASGVWDVHGCLVYKKSKGE